MVLESGKTSRVVASGGCFLLTGTWQEVPHVEEACIEGKKKSWAEHPCTRAYP